VISATNVRVGRRSPRVGAGRRTALICLALLGCADETGCDGGYSANTSLTLRGSFVELSHAPIYVQEFAEADVGPDGRPRATAKPMRTELFVHGLVKPDLPFDVSFSEGLGLPKRGSFFSWVDIDGNALDEAEATSDPVPGPGDLVGAPMHLRFADGEHFGDPLVVDLTPLPGASQERTRLVIGVLSPDIRDFPSGSRILQVRAMAYAPGDIGPDGRPCASCAPMFPFAVTNDQPITLGNTSYSFTLDAGRPAVPLRVVVDLVDDRGTVSRSRTNTEGTLFESERGVRGRAAVGIRFSFSDR
jgi:hypothetical protein